MPGDQRDWIARRRLHGQLLRGPRPAAAEDVITHLTAMQAQDHGYARWSVAQRTSDPAAAAVDRAFGEGRFLRTHVLRPTWHYVAAGDLRWLIGLSGPRVDAANTRRYHDLGLDPQTLSRSAALIAGALAQGPLTRRELAAVLQRQGMPAGGEQVTCIVMPCRAHRADLQRADTRPAAHVRRVRPAGPRHARPQRRGGTRRALTVAGCR